jgi:excisionase family DNA binding protein
MYNPFENIDARLSNIECLLHQIKELPLSNSNQSLEEEFLTTTEAAKFLSLTVPTIYGLIHKGELPVMKRSKRCYFSKEDLFNYIKKGRIKTIDEIKAESNAFDSHKNHQKRFLKKGVYHA